MNAFKTLTLWAERLKMSPNELGHLAIDVMVVDPSLTLERAILGSALAICAAKTGPWVVAAVGALEEDQSTKGEYASLWDAWRMVDRLERKGYEVTLSRKGPPPWSNWFAAICRAEALEAGGPLRILFVNAEDLADFRVARWGVEAWDTWEGYAVRPHPSLARNQYALTVAL